MADNNSKNSSITIKDIAKATGTSYATVSRALNNKYGVHEKTRKLVTETALKMGYQPNIVARNLVLKHTNVIGLIIPDVTNPFFADIVYAVENYATQKGYSVMITNSNWREDLEKVHFDLLIQSRVEGIIIKSALHEKYMTYSYPNSLPIIMLNSGFENRNNISCIDYDDKLGGFLATEHLIKKGYKKIAYIAGETNTYSSQERLYGYKRALKKYNIPFCTDYILNGSFSVESGVKNGSKALSLKNTPDSAFCGNDIIALGVAQSVIEAGLNIPEDFGIIGYDDIYYASLPQIRLTTVAQPRFKMGSMAAEMLIKKIENTENINSEKITLKPYIVERNTTNKIQKEVII